MIKFSSITESNTDLPPMTFASPLKILERLLTTMSANGSTATFTKFPTVSSTTIRKSYRSASARRRGRFGERRSGFEGNSQKRARTGGVPEGCEDVRSASRDSRASISASNPWPKKWQPGPHFCRIFSVSV